MSQEIGPVWGASGVENFGQGYWWHWLASLLCGLDFRKMDLVTKTITLYPREGRMSLNCRNQPREWFPKCIFIYRKKGVALNAVGLSGPGAEAVLAKLRSTVSRRFQPSIMAVSSRPEDRLEEIRQLMAMIVVGFTKDQVPVVQINVSCPNLGEEHGELDERLDEINSILNIVQKHDRLAVIKLSAEFPPEQVVEFTSHPACYGVCVTNTIPFRAVIPWLAPDDLLQIPWDDIFGPGAPSPLRARGVDADGGFSGPHLRDLACEWIRRARAAGMTGHINGCGGIHHPDDVNLFKKAGADSIAIGSVAFLYPWRVQPIIQRAHLVFG